MGKIKYHHVINEEDEHLKERRQKLFGEEAAGKLDENRFGIALSGGGIRSATINLGILKTLNRFGILKKSDYLSTVSGGGYTGAYIQSTLKDKNDYDELFQDDHIDWMRSRGEYLFPGTGWKKMWNQFVFLISYISSLLMSFVSPMVIVLIGLGLYLFIDMTFKGGGRHFENDLLWLFQKGGMVVIGIFILHYVSNVFLNFRLDVSSWFSKIETVVLGVALGFIIWFYFASIKEVTAPNFDDISPYLIFGFILVVIGFFTDPNSTSLHRFYRKQLSDAYLNYAGDYRNMLLKDMFDAKTGNKNDCLAPYPLINTCLNLQSSNDKNFKGTKASDYFLLSPLYCGAKLTGYVSTKERTGYQRMTLPSAVTISAAAVNPGMGNYSSKAMSIMTTLLNLRLGYWVGNPLKLKSKPKSSRQVVWWPLYFFYELLSKIGTDNHKVNVSDGGHIENLGVFELLRRKCRLIIAVDAGADPSFTFADLENLTIRARNELGMEIRFRKDSIPEEVLRPNPSHGYSKKRFAVADIYQLWAKVKNGEEEVIEHYENKKVGTFIYVKSSITAPEGRPELSPDDELKYGTYKYKIYHPDFPHESTADQFFDPIQWESYYQLGQYIGVDILGLDELPKGKGEEVHIDELISLYDENTPLFTSKVKAKGNIPAAEKPSPARTRGRSSFTGKEPTPAPYEEKVVTKDVNYKM